MKRLAIVRSGVVMALMLGVLVAVAAGADASPSGQLRAYMREGLSLERAQAALATQSQVETAELPGRLEEALGTSFAGMWFEPSKGKFCIGVVSGASRRAAEQVVAEAGLAGVVSYVPVRSTWSQLISARGEWKAKVGHLRGQQVSTGLIASHNAVSVRLSSSVPEQERALLEREAARFHTNVLITVVPPEALAVRSRNSQCEWRRSGPEVPPYAFCSKPIAAGVLITPSGTLLLATYCTAGPLAKLANPATLAAELETLLITAGHCLELPDKEKWFTLPHPGLEHIEIGPRITFLDDLAGDYGDIEVGPNWLLAGVTPALAQITNYQHGGLREARNVVGEAASVQNAAFCKQGATSGEQCGTIKELGTLGLLDKLPDELLVHVEGLVRTNACGEGGDSGGPYHTEPEGNAVRILGTEVGGRPFEKCGLLTCPGPEECISQYEPIKTSLTGLKLELLTTSNQTRHTRTWHPLFLTASGQELSFTGEGTNTVLRAENLGVVGTIECKHALITGSILSKSPLVHRIHISFHTDCLQTISGNKTACNEPILPKLALGEIGLLVGKKEVLIKLEPDDGTGTFVTVTCGGMNTTVKGSVIGQIPEINAKGVNQYNKSLTESEQIFQSVGKNSVKQLHTEIELLGVVMTKEELKVEGFFGGPASQEGIGILKTDGGVEICTLAPQNCP